MRIGIFDSGLGGLLIAHSIINHLPRYDYLYFGDTARVPYGNRSRETIYRFTREAVEYLFENDCQLIVLACNTASADALRRIQQEYLPDRYPARRVLGVLIPAAEEAVSVSPAGRIGVLATQGTVESGAFLREISKLRPDAQIIQQSAPLLVPLIEMEGLKYAKPITADYLAPLLDANVECIILGSTHYPILRPIIEELIGPSVRIVDQNDFVPKKLQDYLGRHPEIERCLAKSSRREFRVTDLTTTATRLAQEWFGKEIALKMIPGFC